MGKKRGLLWLLFPSW